MNVNVSRLGHEVGLSDQVKNWSVGTLAKEDLMLDSYIKLRKLNVLKT